MSLLVAMRVEKREEEDHGPNVWVSRVLGSGKHSDGDVHLRHNSQGVSLDNTRIVLRNCRHLRQMIYQTPSNPHKLRESSKLT